MYIDSIYSAYTAYMLSANVIMISIKMTSKKMGIYIYLEIYHAYTVYKKFILQSIQIAYIQTLYYIFRFSA